MSTANTQTPSAAPARRREPDEIRLYSHSNLFYWWPVWAAGLIMGTVSLFSGERMVIVPNDSDMFKLKEGTKGWVITEDTTTPGELKVAATPQDIDAGQIAVILPKSVKLEDESGATRINPPKLTVSSNKSLGVFFCTIFLIVATITNVHLRGLWSLIVIVVLVALIIILSLADAWKYIIPWLVILDVRINTAGYFLISGVLLLVWLVIFFVFDRQTYMVFTPGSCRLRLEIGEGETAYDTRGMTVKKERSDFFRHWILGLGSGDLIVRTTGAQAHQFDLQNVLFLNRKVKAVEDMIRRAGAVSDR